MEKPFASAVICAILSSTNSLLHSGGIYLLLLAHSKNKENSQTLYLLNLAATELLWSLVCIPLDLVPLSPGNDVDGFDIVRFGTWGWLDLFLNLVTFSFNAAAMFMITADRLYQALYPFHHRAYWTVCKTKIAICTSWLSIIVLQVLIVVLIGIYGDFMEKIEDYFTYVISILYFLFAIFTYNRMFSEFVKSTRRVQTTQRTSLLRIFTDSRFSFSILLIGSYLLLVIAPLTFILSSAIRDYDYNSFGRILIRFSPTFDAILYIFLYKPVQSIRKEKCTCFRGSGSQYVPDISIARVI